MLGAWKLILHIPVYIWKCYPAEVSTGLNTSVMLCALKMTDDSPGVPQACLYVETFNLISSGVYTYVR